MGLIEDIDAACEVAIAVGQKVEKAHRQLVCAQYCGNDYAAKFKRVTELPYDERIGILEAIEHESMLDIGDDLWSRLYVNCDKYTEVGFTLAEANPVPVTFNLTELPPANSCCDWLQWSVVWMDDVMDQLYKGYEDVLLPEYFPGADDIRVYIEKERKLVRRLIALPNAAVDNTRKTLVSVPRPSKRMKAPPCRKCGGKCRVGSKPGRIRYIYCNNSNCGYSFTEAVS